MKKDKGKSLFTSILTSSASVVISLSLVLFFIGMLALVLINAQKLSNYVKENIGFTIMLFANFPNCFMSVSFPLYAIYYSFAI